MRKDLDKIVTERERHLSKERNLSTGWHTDRYDDELDEDRVSLPKLGKMKMYNREIRLNKDFSDNLSPLKRWADAQVGRKWDKVFSEIKKNFPRNKLNDHLIYTHLIGYFNIDEKLSNEIEIRTFKKAKGKTYCKVYTKPKYGSGHEIFRGDIYVDPDTGIIKRYNKGKTRHHYKKEVNKTSTGFILDEDGTIFISNEKGIITKIQKIEKIWYKVTFQTVEGEMIKYFGGQYRAQPTFIMQAKKQLNKKELKYYGVANDKK
jgi:hypothetical protein